MPDTPSPTVTFPRELTPDMRGQAERALAMYGEPARAAVLVAHVWSALTFAADQAAAAS